MTDAHKVTKYFCGKAKTKDYKVAIIYIPLILPLTIKCSVIEDLVEDPDVISSLIKLDPLAKKWVRVRVPLFFPSLTTKRKSEDPPSTR